MRVRDIVRRSFEQLVAAGTLPPYGRQGRYVPPPPRHNAPWRPEQLEILHHGAAAGTLYADPAAWESAVAFIRSFTAAAARPDVMPWSIDSFCGSFGEVPADDLLHHLTAGLSGCGLHAIGTNTIARTAHFEATDTATVGALPEPYGKWFQIRERRPRWKEPVALRLMVRIHARIALRPDGRFDGFVDVAMSAPGIALLQNLARELGRSPPRLAGRSWLPAADRLSDPALTLSKGYPHARRF